MASSPSRHKYRLDKLGLKGIMGFIINTLAVNGVVVLKPSREIRPADGAVHGTFLFLLICETLIDWHSLRYVFMELLSITTITGTSGIHKVDNR